MLTCNLARYGAAQIGSRINAIQKEIGLKKRAKEDASDLLKQKAELDDKKKAQEAAAAEKHVALLALAKTVGNYVADSVPVSQTEDDNVLERTWAPEGFDKNEKGALSHHEILS